MLAMVLLLCVTYLSGAIAHEDNVPESQGSLSGFLWIDGNGSNPATDWNGCYDAGENPLAGYPVYLYKADDLSTSIDATITALDGTYTFSDLVPGDYMLSLVSTSVGNNEYLLPMILTEDNSFMIDESYTVAYSAPIKLGAGHHITSLNAGMRLPAGIQPTALTDDLWNAPINSAILIDGREWWVVRKNNATVPGVNHVLLMLRLGYQMQFSTGTANSDFNSSPLRSYMANTVLPGVPTIRSLAVVPTLGSHTLTTVRTLPTATPAGTLTTDILFPLSYLDYVDWMGGTTAPPMFPVHPLASYHIGARKWSRTAANTSNVHATLVYHDGTNNRVQIDSGLSALSNVTTLNPAVWVRTTPVASNVTIYYVDENGNPLDTPTVQPVNYNSTFSLASVPMIPVHTYLHWKIGASGTPNTGTITVPNVTSDMSIFLVYSLNTTEVTIAKEVTGNFANLENLWKFTVLVTNASDIPLPANTSFFYTGGIIPGSGSASPPNGGLILDAQGKGVLLLKHGQTITITGLSPFDKIQILEEPDYNYITTIDDGVSLITNTQTQLVPIGESDLTFLFINDREPFVPTGIRLQTRPPNELILLAALMTLLATGAITIPRKRWWVRV